uniref:CUB-like domain-containing protein n=1 Tax=Panagrolaimus sp. ES5 TaxID=591445 RepID=A0AC34FHG0_9BILA
MFVTLGEWNSNLFGVELFDDSDLTNYVDSSTSSGSCKATVLTYITSNQYGEGLPYFWILKMNTTATEDIIFKSTINQKILFEVKPNEITKWHNVGIYTTALIIILPSNAEIFITFTHAPIYIDYDYPLEGQKGIMASPSYLGYLHNFESLQLYVAANYAEIVVKDFYGSPDIVYYSNGYNYTLIPSINLSLIVDDIKLYYQEKDASQNGFLIEYTMHGRKPTTTSAIQTTSTLKSTKTTTLKPSIDTSTSSVYSTTAIATISMNSTLNSASTVTLFPSTHISTATTSTSVAPTTVTNTAATTAADTVTKPKKPDNNFAIFVKFDVLILVFSVILSLL